jgi:hypothetical protein
MDLMDFYKKAYTITQIIEAKKPSNSSFKCIYFQTSPIESLLIPVMEERSPRTLVVVPKQGSSFDFNILSPNNDKVRKISDKDLLKVNQSVSQDYSHNGWHHLGVVMESKYKNNGPQKKTSKSALEILHTQPNYQFEQVTKRYEPTPFWESKPMPNYLKPKKDEVVPLPPIRSPYSSSSSPYGYSQKTSYGNNQDYVPPPPPRPPSSRYSKEKRERDQMWGTQQPYGSSNNKNYNQGWGSTANNNNKNNFSKSWGATGTGNYKNNYNQGWGATGKAVEEDLSFFKDQNQNSPLQRQLQNSKQIKPLLQKAAQKEIYEDFASQQFYNPNNNRYQTFVNFPSLMWYGMKGAKGEKKSNKSKKQKTETMEDEIKPGKQEMKDDESEKELMDEDDQEKDWSEDEDDSADNKKPKTKKKSTKPKKKPNSNHKMSTRNKRKM